MGNSTETGASTRKRGGRVVWSKRSLSVGELRTPLGVVGIAVGPSGLLRIDLPGKAAVTRRRLLVPGWEDLPVVAADARVDAVTKQLLEYFAGRRRRFELPLDLRGSEFDRAVWNRVAKIRYATVETYGDVAKDIGRPSAFRAVGAANGRNPIPIVVPCHRVVGTGGRLTGYGGGLDLKARLLRLEGVALSDAAATARTRAVPRS